MLELKFRLEGDETLSRRLRGVSTELKDFRQPLQKSATILLKDIRLNFDTEGGLVGKWAPLAPATEKDRTRKGFGTSPILHRTGRYKRSFKGEISRNKLIIDAWGVDYHKYHQSSAPRKQGKNGDILPRRRTLFMRNKVKKEIQRFFQEYVRFN